MSKQTRTGLVGAVAVIAVFGAGIAIGTQTSKLRGKKAHASEGNASVATEAGDSCGGAEGSALSCGGKHGEGEGTCGGSADGCAGHVVAALGCTGEHCEGADCSTRGCGKGDQKCEGNCDEADCKEVGCGKTQCEGDCSDADCADANCTKATASANAKCAHCADGGKHGLCVPCLTKGVDLTDEQKETLASVVRTHNQRLAKVHTELRSAIETQVEGEAATQLVAALSKKK